MTLELRDWDMAEHLRDDEDIAAYLGFVFSQDDTGEMRRALGHVARARGLTQLAEQAGITRAGLRRALGENGNPSFDTIHAILKALRFKLSVLPIDDEARAAA